MRAVRIVLLCWIAITPALLVGQVPLKQDEPATLFSRGNSEYQKGNYAAAEYFYLQILSAEAESGAVYYNLGNACFKQKKLGSAIYYWEKAQQQAPADNDIKDNLQLAGLMIVDRIETKSDPFPLRMLSAMQSFLSIRQTGWIVLALFVGANLFFSLYLISKSRNSFRALLVAFVFAILLIAFGISLSWKIYQQDYVRQGIVVEQKADVRSGPGQENIAVFTIHEGIKVRVLSTTGGWYQISLPNGWNGWLPRDYLRIL
jgi:tetratricopeptide (TPR) repeat protein